MSKEIEPNVNKTIEPNGSNKIEQIESKQKEIEINQTIFNTHFKAYLYNISIPSLTTLFGRNTADKLSISITDQSSDTNLTRMEHLLLLATNIYPKEIVIGSAQLGCNLIRETNQGVTSIHILVHGDWEFPFGSRKISNKMSVYFGQKADDKIGMNPSRTIGISRPRPQIISTRLRNCDIFDFFKRGSPWHGKMKHECENLVETLVPTTFSKMLSAIFF